MNRWFMLVDRAQRVTLINCDQACYIKFNRYEAYTELKIYFSGDCEWSEFSVDYSEAERLSKFVMP